MRPRRSRRKTAVDPTAKPRAPAPVASAGPVFRDLNGLRRNFRAPAGSPPGRAQQIPDDTGAPLGDFPGLLVGRVTAHFGQTLNVFMALHLELRPCGSGDKRFQRVADHEGGGGGLPRAVVDAVVDLRHAHISNRGANPFPGFRRGRWRVAPDGVWPAASKRVDSGLDCMTVTAILHRTRPAFRTPSGRYAATFPTRWRRGRGLRLEMCESPAGEGSARSGRCVNPLGC